MAKSCIASLCIVLSLAASSFVVAADWSERAASEPPLRATCVSPKGAPATANQLADALLIGPSQAYLAGATLQAQGVQAGFFSNECQDFPIHDDTYVILSTGRAANAFGNAQTFESVDVGGTVVPGGSPDGYDAYDVARLEIELDLPATAKWLKFSFKFGSEESPTFLLTPFQDYFKATVRNAAGAQIAQIAVLPSGQIVTVDNARFYSNVPGGDSTSPHGDLPEGTVYNAVTDDVHTGSCDVSGHAGQRVSIEFEVGDASDPIYDTAVFLDNLRVVTADGVVETWASLIPYADPGQEFSTINFGKMYTALHSYWKVPADHFSIYREVIDGVSWDLSRDEFRSHVQYLGDHADGDDIAILYYTGHGGSRDGGGVVGARYWMMDIWFDQMVHASDTIVILQSCKTGKATEVLDGPGNWIVASTGPDSLSTHGYEGTILEPFVGGGGSIFTFWFADAIVWGMFSPSVFNLIPDLLSTIDTNFDGNVSVREAFSYAKRNTCLTLEHLFGGDQGTPQMSPSSGDVIVPQHNQGWFGNLLTWLLSCPVELIIRDPLGRELSSTVNGIGDGAFYVEGDFDGDGEIDRQYIVFDALPGDYTVEVVPLAGALPGQTYDLVVVDKGIPTIIADDVPIGAIPPVPYVYTATPPRDLFRQDGLASGGAYGPHILEPAGWPRVWGTLSGVGGTGCVAAYSYGRTAAELAMAAPFDSFALHTGLEPVYFFDLNAGGFVPGAGGITATLQVSPEMIDGFLEGSLQLFYWDIAAQMWVTAPGLTLNAAGNALTAFFPLAALGGTPIGLGGMGASGDQETDVVDASTNVPDVAIDAGDELLVQTFKIGDPGTIGDTVPDGYDTYIETITVDQNGPAPRIPDAEVVGLKLYRDNGDTFFDPASDALLGTLGGFSPAGNAVFGIPGLLLTQITDNTTVWFHVVAEFTGAGLTTNASYRGQVTGVTIADPLIGRSSALEPGWIVPLPADSERILYTRKMSTGSAETTVEDETDAVFAAPGAVGVILQEAVIWDGDTTLPGVPPIDGHDTDVRDIRVRKVGGTLDPSYIRNLRLEVDNDGDGIPDLFPGPWIGTPNLIVGETFNNLPNAVLTIPNTDEYRLWVVADVAAGAPLGATLTVELEIETADGLQGAGPISSQIVTAMPVDAGNQLTIGASVLGDQETDAVDDTTPRTVIHGEVGVVVQTVRLEDAGAGVDAVEDGYPTRIDTMTITGIGNLAVNGLLSSLALYVESDGVLGWSGGDAQLGATIVNPDLTGAGEEFGTLGTLLLEVPDHAERLVYVVAGIDAGGGVNGDALRTTFNATVFQSAGSSSRFEPNIPGAFPLPVQVAAADQTTLSVPAGDNEADLTDQTLARVIQPGAQRVVIQQFVLEDPGNRGDTVDDTFILEIADITVRLTDASTITEDDIQWIRLYRENDGTAGFSGGDMLVGAVNVELSLDPVLDGRITFQPVAPWSEVAERETYYVALDFLAGRPVNGAVLTSTVTVKPVGGGWRSGIEDPQPLIASNLVSVGPIGALIDIHDLTIQPAAAGNLPITVDTGLMADFQVGGVAPYVGRLTITESDQVDVTGVTGAGPYSVVASTITDPDTPGVDITVEFELHLDAGQAPAAGTVLNVGILGTGADGDTCVADITVVDVFRDQAANPIPNTVSAGLITLTATAPQNGDVNCDGGLDITDARLVAEHAIGLIDLCVPNLPQWCGDCWRGDVAPPYGVLDVTDARWIAEAAIGLRTLRLAQAAPQSAVSLTSLEINSFAELAISGSAVADVQGTLYYDPDEIRITSVEGVNGFEVLASWIDKKAGLVRFAAANLSGGPISNGPIVMFRTVDDLSSATLSIDVLRNSNGQDIPFDVQNVGPAGQILEFGCSPNPVQDVHTTYFSVKATSLVDQIRVYIYDFSGQLVYDSGYGPNDLAWHLENDAGNVLANGVYYYRMEVLFAGTNEPVVTGIGRVAVYR